MSKLRLVCAVLVLSLGAAAHAEGPTTSVEDFLAYMTELRTGLESDHPKPLSEKEWQLFDSADRDIRRILAGKASIDELSLRQQEQLINAQERVTAILTGAEDDRLICRRERTVGTHFQRTTCVTVRQRRQEQEDAQHALNRMPASDIPEQLREGGPLRRE